MILYIYMYVHVCDCLAHMCMCRYYIYRGTILLPHITHSVTEYPSHNTLINLLIHIHVDAYYTSVLSS